jgi:hypothetical protein
MTNQQIMLLQQSKIKQQDSELDDIVGGVKKGRKHAKELKEELLQQNTLLGYVEKDVRAYLMI